MIAERRICCEPMAVSLKNYELAIWNLNTQLALIRFALARFSKERHVRREFLNKELSKSAPRGIIWLRPKPNNSWDGRIFSLRPSPRKRASGYSRTYKRSS